MLLSLLSLFLVLKDLLLGFLVLCFGLLLGIDFGLLLVLFVLQQGLLVVVLLLLGAGGSVGGIRFSGAESSVRNVPDATVISLAPGCRTWTNASRAMMAAAARTACRRRERLLAPTAVLTSRKLISPSKPVAITHGAGLS